MDIHVWPPGHLSWPRRRVRCAIGRGGVTADKREGDGATPVGRLPLRRLYYRADRLPEPLTALPSAALGRDHGWCDDPTDPDYNRLVRRPPAGGQENLWRDDGAYDLIVVLGYNDDPPLAGHGSAIFLHVARPDYAATEGCVALALEDLLDLVADCDETTRLIVAAGMS